jgi:predicted aldo/keto reductase-like oxidoreductase
MKGTAMSKLDRRAFLQGSAAVAGAGVTATLWAKSVAETQPACHGPRQVTDVVSLAKTGIKPSRLSIGTGTMGGSEQKRQGIDGMVKVFRHGLDRGVKWWDTADMYKTHPHVAATLKEIKRDQVVITSKTRASDAKGVREDIERFRKELNTDYIDIVLLHCMMDGDWNVKRRESMDVLSEYKSKGVVRAVGCSCHTFEALEAASNEPWVDVDLARINPYAVKMDVTKVEDVPKVEKVLEKMHDSGKAVYGMKILGEGEFKTNERIETSLKFAMTRPYLSGFTIGFSMPRHLDDIITRVERMEVKG